MSAEQLAMVAGVILSLIFSYVPGVSDWYANRTSQAKSLIMALLLALVAAGAFGLSCSNIITAVTCTREGVMGLVYAFIAALIANQATYSISPQKS